MQVELTISLLIIVGGVKIYESFNSFFKKSGVPNRFAPKVWLEISLKIWFYYKTVSGRHRDISRICSWKFLQYITKKFGLRIII